MRGVAVSASADSVSAHTPGPWVAVVGGADGKVRCSDGRYFLVGDLIYHEDNKANARLIAAAPELLAAAKQVAADFDLQIHGGSAVDYMKHWQALVATIAKAEGR